MAKVILTLFVAGIFGLHLDASRVPEKNIQDVFDSETFKDAGLHKLTTQELEALSGALYGWKLASKSGEIHTATAVGPVQEPLVGDRSIEVFGNERIEESKRKQQESKLPKSIKSRILGEFRGWKGKTTFELDNGQVWVQTDGKRFVIKTTDPEVEIKKGLLGAYYLKVKGWGSRCKVERVK